MNLFILLAEISCINKIQREFKSQNRNCKCPNPCRWTDSSIAIFSLISGELFFFFRKKIKPKFSFIRFPRSSIKLIHTLITWYFREKKYSLFPSSRQWPTEKYSVRIRCGGSIICGNMIIGDGDDSGGGGGRFWWWPYCKPTIFRVLEISPRRREYFSPQIKPSNNAGVGKGHDREVYSPLTNKVVSNKSWFWGRDDRGEMMSVKYRYELWF